MDQERTNGTYVVVANHEEQYSIWVAGRDLPTGWSEAGKRGTKEECLDHIRQVWTDMRPRSLRNYQSEQAASSPTASPAGVKVSEEA